MLNNIIKMIKNKKGSTMVIFALSLVSIFGIMALTVDVGFVALEQVKLSNAADAAALAGAHELLSNKETAVSVAKEYLLKNGVSESEAVVNISEDDNTVNVTVNKDVNYFFAKVLGLYKTKVNKNSVAKCGTVTGVYSGVRPFAIQKQQLVFGQEYALKQGGGSGDNGNYGALALEGNGASIYVNTIVYGYEGQLKVGDIVTTEPGNMSGPTKQGITQLLSMCTHNCTFENHEPNCPKLVTVIIVESLPNGRGNIPIVGFASFFIEGVEGNGNDSIVKGRFLKNVIDGDIGESSNDFGLKAVKLIK